MTLRDLPRNGRDVADSMHTARRCIRAAWLAAARGETDWALEALREALERDPGDVLALDLTITLLEGAERHAEMVELLERRAVLSADGVTASAVLSRLGSLLEDELGDPGGARRAYEQALRADPGGLTARRGLSRCYRKSGAWGPLRELLESQRAFGTASTRATLLCELAELLEEQFGERVEAMTVYEEAIRLGSLDARQRLQRLREAGETNTADPKQRVEALRAELPRTKGAEQVAIHLELAELLDRELRERSSALAHLQRALELDPMRVEALDRAMGLAGEMGGAFAQLDLVEHLYQRTEGRTAQARLLAHRGDLLADEMGWRDEAKRSWQASLALDPDQATARARLERSKPPLKP